MSKLPLEGVRVLDFTWAAVGPYCTFLCSMMGAECIKVETSTRAGYFQRRTPLPVADLDTRMRVVNWVDVNELNVNKLSIQVNLKHPAGLRTVRQLVAVSDAVVDNFRAGVMRRLGLGYEDLLTINPSLVVVSSSTHGQEGPEAYGTGFAQVFGALAGAAYLTGYDGGPPVELRLPSDLIAGTMTAYALLAGVYHARRTGVGQFVDIANRECFASFIGEALLDAAINHRDQMRQGNRDERMAPHNVYRCKGEDAWISIAVATEEEWQALCRAVGHPEWLADPRFADPYRRWRHQEELDRLLSQWTAEQIPIEAMEALQRAGVAATPSASAVDLMGDPHVSERQCLLMTENVDREPWLMMGVPWRFSAATAEVVRPPPVLGLDNRCVLGELLGMTTDEVGELVRQGAVQ